MSWTRGTPRHDSAGGEGERRGERERERPKQSARNETKPPPTTAAMTAAATASQNLNDKQTVRQGDRETGRHTNEWTAGQWDSGTDGNFLHTNSVTDKQGRKRENSSSSNGRKSN